MEERREHQQLSVERWLLDELPPEERERVERVLSPEERAALRAADAELRARLMHTRPPELFAREVTRRAARTRKASSAPVFGLAFAAALTAGVALISLPPREVQVPTEERVAEPGERTKGIAPQLRVYRKRGEHAERLEENTFARAHDVLQLGYVAAGRPYGVLFSLDGRGTITLHAPNEPSLSSPLEHANGEHLLGSAYELDAAPAFERFFFVVSREPLDTETVLAAARELSQDPRRAATERLKLPDSVEQHSLLLRKEGL